MPFPIIRKNDAAQIGVTRKANPKKIEDFALQPIGARPDGDQRIDDRIVTVKADLEAQAVAAGDGNQFVVQFETRFMGETIHAGGIGEEVEIEFAVLATSLRKRAKRFVGNNNGGFSAVLKDFSHRVGIPCAQVVSYNTSVLGGLRHNLEPASAGYRLQSSAPFFQR